MNGGSASFAFPLAHSFSLVAEAGAEANSNVTSSGLDLTFSDYLAGPRYSLRKASRITPFAQLLLGAAHTSGALSPGQYGMGSSTAFAMATGGGLDLNLTRRFAWRLHQNRLPPDPVPQPRQRPPEQLPLQHRNRLPLQQKMKEGTRIQMPLSKRIGAFPI